MGKGIVRVFEMDMYTPLYLKWITNKGLLAQRREPCTVLTNAHCSSLLKEQHRYFPNFDRRYGKNWSLMEIDDSLGRKLR